MPRSLILGNGTMLATFDHCLQMRDMYFPFVGMEDHTTYGNLHRIGVFVEGRGFSWVSDPEWEIKPSYKRDTLVGESQMINERLGIAFTVEDCVHPVHDILLRRFRVISLDDDEKRVRLFFNHNFHIYGDTQKDTAFYEPYTNCIIHFRQTRYFLIGGSTDNPEECFIGATTHAYDSVLHRIKRLSSCGISSFTVGKANFRGLEGTWRDAEDGVLSKNPIEQGSVDSTVAIHLIVKPGKPSEATLWLCAGRTLDEVVDLQQVVIEETSERLIRNTANYWKSWVNKTPIDAGGLSADVLDLYRRSLMMIRVHCDNRGGILAAADSDIMAFNRDTYTYVWPRDGAFVSMALDRAGYYEVSKRFFEFCCRVQSPDGYMMHKFNPDGSMGSSWHPWFKDGEPQLPIQEDETALVLVALMAHFEQVQDFEFLQQMYEKFVERAAQFLCDFREEETGLPLPSYDLWEEHRGIFTYTVATTIAGLEAAAQISHVLGHATHAERYRKAANSMKEAMITHLYDEPAGRFVKKIRRKGNETIERDLTPDASICMVWKLGVLPPDDPRVISTMEELERALTVRSSVGGMARYTLDVYQTDAPPSAEIPGNPWIITTLWRAQWVITCAQTKADLLPAKQILEWVKKYATSTGILPEQLHPHTGASLSVAPLTWSHSTFVETVLMYVEKEKGLENPV